MVGPRFIDEIDLNKPTLDGPRYVRMLKNEVLPVLREELEHRFDQCIHRQDSASPHRSRVAIDYLESVLEDGLIELNSRSEHE